MQLAGEHRIGAPVETVWRGLNDPDVLRRSIPGCEAMESTGDHEFTATVLAQVGPVSARFKGKVDLIDLDPPHSYTITGRGQGGPAGFAKGSAYIRLERDGADTKLSYDANIDVGGKLGSVGSRLIKSVANKNAESFFANFARTITGEPVAETLPPVPTRPESGLARHGAHIPLIDRVAWLAAGIGLGAGLMALLG